jgi:hypothetical protein
MEMAQALSGANDNMWLVPWTEIKEKNDVVLLPITLCHSFTFCGSGLVAFAKRSKDPGGGNFALTWGAPSRALRPMAN